MKTHISLIPIVFSEKSPDSGYPSSWDEVLRAPKEIRRYRVPGETEAKNNRQGSKLTRRHQGAEDAEAAAIHARSRTSSHGVVTQAIRDDREFKRRRFIYLNNV